MEKLHRNALWKTNRTKVYVFALRALCVDLRMRLREQKNRRNNQLKNCTCDIVRVPKKGNCGARINNTRDEWHARMAYVERHA